MVSRLLDQGTIQEVLSWNDDYELRKEAMLAECEVPSEVFRGVEDRMVKFVKPFAELFTQPAQRKHAKNYSLGLVSDLERKNVESIA